MTDKITGKQRSWNMSQIRSKNTKPEIIVRSALHKMGYRFRIHNKDLSGKPDIVLNKYKTVIFVHGCFWHYHNKCSRANMPKSNKKYWSDKIEGNIQRDKKHKKILVKEGWNVIIIWECQTKNEDNIVKLFKKQLKK